MYEEESQIEESEDEECVGGEHEKVDPSESSDAEEVADPDKPPVLV